MSLSEEDIQASAKMAGLRPKSMANDTAHYFRRRTVLQVFGDLSGLSRMAACSPPSQGERGRFVPLLDEAGYLDADLYIVSYQESWLIDVHIELADSVVRRLETVEGVIRVDRSAGDRWRVFGELPDQKSAETSFETLLLSSSSFIFPLISILETRSVF
jgi:hypothetical protein